MKSVRVYQNGIPVWRVEMQSLRTGEKINLEVTGAANGDATFKCIGLFGDYAWTGTDPLYAPNPANIQYYYEEEEEVLV